MGKLWKRHNNIESIGDRFRDAFEKSTAKDENEKMK